MTNYTSQVNGNWSSSSTWTPAGVPGNGDTVVIQHTVTVTANATIGTSPASMQTSGSAPYGNAINVLNLYNAILGGHSGNGYLIIAAGVTLTVRGDILLAQGNLTLNAGSVLQFDSTLAASPSTTYYVLDQITGPNWGGDPVTGYLIMNGTAGNRAVVQTVTGCMPARITPGFKPLGGAVTTQQVRDSGVVQCSYGRFYRMGDATHYCLNPWIGNGPVAPYPTYQFYLRHTEFDTCGPLFFYQGMDTVTYIDMSYVTFKNSVAPVVGLSIGSSTTIATGGLRNIYHCVFDKEVDFPGTRDFVIDSNVFLETYGITTSPIANTMVTNNFVGNLTHVNSSGDITAFAANGATAVTQCMVGWGITFNNNYVCFNNSWYVNAHMLGAWTSTGVHGYMVVSNCIGEFTGPDPNGDFLLTTEPLTLVVSRADNTIFLTNNIILPNGNGSQSATLITDENANAGFVNTVIENNIALSDVNGQGVVAINEATIANTNMAGEYLSLRSNIFWNYPANLIANVTHSYSAWDEIPGVADTDQVSSSILDYNVHYNMKVGSNWVANVVTNTVGYHQFHWSTGTPGTHDRVLNPMFVDPARNLAKFDLAVLGGPGTANDGFVQLAKMNDDSGFNANATITNLMAYVRAGYCPTHPALIRGSHNGQTVGAVQSNAPYITIVMG